MRIPSFNDFSPGILKTAFGEPDLRKALEPVIAHEGDRASTVDAWASSLFSGVQNKRSSTNVPATLHSTGLLDTENWRLTNLGATVANSPSALEAARVFAKSILLKKNGTVLIDAVTSLNLRGENVTKASLKNELVDLGVEGLSTATTDHTTLRNWFVVAGVLGPKSENFKPNDKVSKMLLGISVTERVAFQSLPLPQQIFLSVFRRMVETETSNEELLF